MFGVCCLLCVPCHIVWHRQNYISYICPIPNEIERKFLIEYPDISLGTVYRNLALFKQQGLIQSVATVNGPERFDANIEPHVHFICTDCDAVIDLPAEKQAALKAAGAEAQEITLGIRPDHITLCEAGDKAAIAATVDVTELMGAEIYLYLNVGKSEEGDGILIFRSVMEKLLR